jgi:hypothetical protein
MMYEGGPRGDIQQDGLPHIDSAARNSYSSLTVRLQFALKHYASKTPKRPHAARRLCSFGLQILQGIADSSSPLERQGQS